MIRKKFTALLLVLAVIMSLLANTAYAAPLEGENSDEKAFYAAYDIYEFMSLLIDNYVGDTLTAEQLYEAALRGIAAELDEYSELFTEKESAAFVDNVSGNYEGLGILLAGEGFGFVFIMDVFEDSPADKAGILPGDIFYRINGTDVTGKTLSQVSDILSASPKTVKLELKRGETKKTFTVTKGKVHRKSARIYKLEDMLPNADSKKTAKTRYVSLTTFGEDTAVEFAAVLDELKKDGIEYIILDLRGNAGGRMDILEEVAELIVPAGIIYTTQTGDGEKYQAMSKLSASPFKHIIVLTNGGTASAAEVLVSALQDSKAATVIGQTTYGKGVAQVHLPTLTGGVLSFTFAQNFRRNGGKINGVGVKPDIAVEVPNFVAGYADSESEAKAIISEVKKGLTYIGYEPGKANSYDAAAKSAIEKFQTDVGLTPTGIPDYETVNALNEAIFEKYMEKDYELEEAYRYLIEKFLK